MAKIAEHGATVLAHHPLPVPGLLGVRHRIRGPCPDILMRVSNVCVCWSLGSWSDSPLQFRSLLRPDGLLRKC